MICSKCGKEIPNDSRVCSYCGAPQVVRSGSGQPYQNQPVMNATFAQTVEPKKKKKKWLIVLAVLVALVIIGSVLGGSDSEEDVKKSSGNGASVSDSQSEEKKASQTIEQSNIFNVGDSLETSKEKILFKSAEKWTGYNEYFSPKSGYMIVRVFFEIENIGSSDLYYNRYDFDCYADGVAADEYIYGDESLSSGALSPGRKASGYAYFEVPENSQDIEVEYETNYWTQNKVIFKVSL